MMRRARRGFTLIEMVVVMVIITIVATLVAPSFGGLGLYKQQTTTTVILGLFHDARQFAITHGTTVTLELDPATGRFRADTTGVGGTGYVIQDSLSLGATEGLETTQPRLRYVFFPSGAAYGDSMTIRGSDSTRAVFIDHWSGNAYTVPR